MKNKMKIKKAAIKEYLDILENYLKISDMVEDILYFYFKNPGTMNSLEENLKSLWGYEKELQTLHSKLASIAPYDPVFIKDNMERTYSTASELAKSLYKMGAKEVEE